MASTYNPTSSGSGRNRVRFLIGDTDFTSAWALQMPHLDDAEIDSELTRQAGNEYLAAIECVTALIGKIAQRAFRFTHSKRTEDWTGLRAHYEHLQQMLRAQMARSGATPYAGGQSFADKDLARQDPDRTVPFFGRSMGTMPGTEPSVEPSFSDPSTLPW